LIGSRVTKRYAKALFELSREENVLDRVEQDLVMIIDTYHNSSDLAMLLASPIIQSRDKKKALQNIFKGKVHNLTFDFLMLLLEKNREENLPDIITNFGKFLDESRGILRSNLITAHPFTSEQKNALIKQLEKHTGKQILIEEVLDSSLIAGFVVRMEDTVIDTSIKNQLNKMRQSLIST
jgi:F-type H+-transporting ATPase subunit delta